MPPNPPASWPARRGSRPADSDNQYNGPRVTSYQKCRIPCGPALLGAMAAFLLLAGCSKESEPPGAVSVQAAKVRRGTINQVITAEAVLFPIQQSAITPKISSPVSKFLVNRGSHVRQGQLLAVLENRDLQASEMENKGAYEQAEAQYATTTVSSLPEEIQKAEQDTKAAKLALDAEQKVYDGRENLFQQGALPRKELDQSAVSLTQARNQYELAAKHLAALQATVKQQDLKAAAGQLSAAKGKYMGAQAQLGYSEVRSPIDGVVTDRPLFPGEMAAAGAPLLTVMNLSRVIAKAHIPQQEAAQLKANDPATISAPGADDLPGKVTLVSPAVDPNSTTVEVWVEAANPKEQLRPGATVRVAMVAQTVADALIIPAASLLTGEDGATTVMVVGSDNHVHAQPVTVGIRQENEVQVTSGLKAGETVVTTGAFGLPDKALVKIETGQEEHGKPGGSPSGEKE